LTEYQRPAPLDAARHSPAEFESGEPVLDEWLRRYAGQNRRRDTAATWVIADAADVVVAYASVAMSAIDRSAAPATLGNQAPDPIPALLIGRLAVDQTHAGLGLGTALVSHILATAVELNAKAACRAVIASALDSAAHRWWQRMGFQRFELSEQSPDLHLLTADIQATLQRLPR
jgi:GNAT superfamily N-acetyltransferase